MEKYDLVEFAPKEYEDWQYVILLIREHRKMGLKEFAGSITDDALDKIFGNDTFMCDTYESLNKWYEEMRCYKK